MTTLLVGVLMGFVATALVHAGMVVYQIRRGSRFGQLLIAEANDSVVVMFDQEAGGASSARLALRAATGGLASQAFTPYVARQIAVRLLAIAGEIEARGGGSRTRSGSGDGPGNGAN